MITVPHIEPGRYSSSSLYFPQRDLSLHALITSCGHSRETERKYDWHGLKRGRTEFALIQYTLDGAGRLVYEGADFAVGPGQAMLLHFPHDNRYYLPPESSHWEFIYVCVHGSEVMRLWGAMERRAGPLLTLAPDSAVVEIAARIVANAGRDEITSPYQSSALAYQLTMSLLESVRGSASESDRPEAIDKVVRFCRANVGQAITVDDMAAIAGLSRYHFSRVFASVVGAAPGEYLRELRIRKAAQLLQTTSRTVKDIAEEMGFYDATYFCKSFRTVVGTTPKSFRNSGMYGQASQ